MLGIINKYRKLMKIKADILNDQKHKCEEKCEGGDWGCEGGGPGGSPRLARGPPKAGLAVCNYISISIRLLRNSRFISSKCFLH